MLRSVPQIPVALMRTTMSSPSVGGSGRSSRRKLSGASRTTACISTSSHTLLRWIQGPPTSLFPPVRGVLDERRDRVPVLRDHYVFFEAHALLQPWATGEGLYGEVHVGFDFGRVVERVGTGDPHPLVERESYRVCELLERNAAVLVVVVFREFLRNVGGRIAGLHLLDGRVEGVVTFFVKVFVRLGRLPVDLPAAHEVYKVTARPNGVDIDDDVISLAERLVRMPAPVGAGITTRGADDLVDEVEARAV